MAGNARGCSGYRRSSRREFLKVGTLGFMGLTMADVLSAEAAEVAAKARGKSCIVVWLNGGPPAMDLWDMKPEAPGEVRGEFKPIKTNVAGIEICEHLPTVARQMDKISLIRSIHHRNGCHDIGPTIMQSGFRPLTVLPGGIELPIADYPSYQTTIAVVQGSRDLFPHVTIPNTPRGASTGYLGPRYNPFEVAGDPNKPSFTVRDLAPPKGVTDTRLDRRRALLQAVDSHFRQTDETLECRTMDRFYEQAYSVTGSTQARQAFDLKQEPDALRDEYGRTTIGQSCLMARRLVEAGVRCVTVNNDGWDTHEKNFEQLKSKLLPGLDKAFGTLVKDLHQRGLLKNTLVLCMGEFSRTPIINSTAGRDHWADCISVALAGGGVPGGVIVGASDKTCAYPAEDPLDPSRLAATVYHHMGIPGDTRLLDISGRPMPVLPRPAAPIEALV
jgi:Protein of unknown function (DUF1501)